MHQNSFWTSLDLVSQWSGHSDHHIGYEAWTVNVRLTLDALNKLFSACMYQTADVPVTHSLEIGTKKRLKFLLILLSVGI